MIAHSTLQPCQLHRILNVQYNSPTMGAIITRKIQNRRKQGTLKLNLTLRAKLNRPRMKRQHFQGSVRLAMRLRERNEKSYLCRKMMSIPLVRVTKRWGNRDLLPDLVTENSLIEVRLMREITATLKTLT